MLLKEHFEKSGTWLFKWRSFLPLLLPILCLEGLLQYHYPCGSHTLALLWQIVCLAISFAGLGVRALTIGSVPKGTSGRNTKRVKGDFLNTTGMYSIARHPLYLGNCIIGFGISLFFLLWWITLLFVLIFWLYYERIIFAEEEFLIKEYGQPYMKWADKTPAFLPRFKNWTPAALPFSLKTALKAEYHTLMAIIACFAFLGILGDSFVKGEITLDLPWLIIFSGGLLTWIIIRIFHKKTRILKAEGR